MSKTWWPFLSARSLLTKMVAFISDQDCRMTDHYIATRRYWTRLSSNPRSPHYVEAIFEHDVGIRLNGKEAHQCRGVLH